MSSSEINKVNLFTGFIDLLKTKDNKIRILGFSILVIWVAFYFCYPLKSKSVSESIKKKSPKVISKINNNTSKISESPLQSIPQSPILETKPVDNENTPKISESPLQSMPQSPILETKPIKLFSTPTGVDNNNTHIKNLSPTISSPTKKIPLKVGDDLDNFINTLRNPGFNVIRIRIKDSEEKGKVLRLNRNGELFFFHDGLSGLINKISPLKNKKLHLFPLANLNDIIDANEKPLSFLLEFKDLKPIHISGENDEETLYMKNGFKLLVNKVKVDSTYGIK